MSGRVNEKDLISYADIISEEVGKTFYIDMAYGGYKLVRLWKENSTGVIDVQGGYGTKRECLTFCQGVLTGVEAMEEKREEKRKEGGRENE